MVERAKLPSEQVRRIIAGSGLVVHRLAEMSGVTESALSRFMSGETRLSLKHIDRLALVLGLTITSRPPEKTVRIRADIRRRAALAAKRRAARQRKGE